MGQFLLCAGAPGKRFALPHARIMMHQPSGGVQGQATDIAIQAEQMIYIKRLMAERIAFHTGQTVEQIEEDSERDRWFTAEQAKEYGIIDHVIASKRGEIRCVGRRSARRRRSTTAVPVGRRSAERLGRRRAARSRSRPQSTAAHAASARRRRSASTSLAARRSASGVGRAPPGGSSGRR